MLISILSVLHKYLAFKCGYQYKYRFPMGTEKSWNLCLYFQAQKSWNSTLVQIKSWKSASFCSLRCLKTNCGVSLKKSCCVDASVPLGTCTCVSISGNLDHISLLKQPRRPYKVLIFWHLCCWKRNAMKVTKWPNQDFFEKDHQDVEIRDKCCLKQDKTHSNASLCLKSLCNSSITTT